LPLPPGKGNFPSSRPEPANRHVIPFRHERRVSVFKRLRDRLEAALAAATPPPDLGEIAARMREAVIEQKAGVRAMRDALAEAERSLAREQEQLHTAERRREQAAGI